MQTRILVPVVLLVTVALIVVTGACLVHADGAPDLCSSLVAATLGVMLALSLGRPQQIVFVRLDSYHPASFDPPAPPPKV